jgi:hypothetical protein
VTNSLIATSDHKDSPTDGLGLTSDVADTINAAHDDDRIGTVAGAAGVLTSLADFTDPLDGLIKTGLGALVERVGFLREPLDHLCGDADQIMAHSQTWQNVSARLRQVADHREQGLAELTSWTGSAADSYRAAATAQVGSLRDTARSAADLSEDILRNGIMVALERSIIKDAIVTFVSTLIEDALASLASLGLLAPEMVAKAVLEATSLATKLAARVSKLLTTLAHSAHRMELLGTEITRVVGKLGSAAGPAGARALELGGGALDELGRAGGKTVEELTDPMGRATSALIEAAKADGKALHERAEADERQAREPGWAPL